MLSESELRPANFWAVLQVKSTATSSPVLTLSNGGKLIVGKSTVATGSLKAVSSTYPLTLDIQDGTLEIDGGTVRDLAQDATTGSALYVGDGGMLVMKNSGTIYGSSASASDMATVKIDGGNADLDSSSIINVGNTGTALWVEKASGSFTNTISRVISESCCSACSWPSPKRTPLRPSCALLKISENALH